MATVHSAKDLAKFFDQMASATERGQKAALIKGATQTKQIFLTTAASRGVRPGGRIAGKPWNVRYDLLPGNIPSAVVKFTGPFHLVESATKPHEITPKAGRSQRRRGRATNAKALRIGGEFRASASHPGTRGKKVFATGKQIAGPRVTQTMATEVVKVWAGVVK